MNYAQLLLSFYEKQFVVKKNFFFCQYVELQLMTNIYPELFYSARLILKCLSKTAFRGGDIGNIVSPRRFLLYCNIFSLVIKLIYTSILYIIYLYYKYIQSKEPKSPLKSMVKRVFLFDEATSNFTFTFVCFIQFFIKQNGFNDF